jgi:hypothetical protein
MEMIGQLHSPAALHVGKESSGARWIISPALNLGKLRIITVRKTGIRAEIRTHDLLNPEC